MRSLILAAPLVLFVCSASAQSVCPDPADVQGEMLNLIAKSNAAENAMDGRRISDEMWEVWLRAPDAAAKATLDAGMSKRDVFDFAGALTDFDALADYCPTYAEGFNQRAFVHYLRGEYDKALVDLDLALGLQPYHIAAQAGRALTLMNLGRIEEARAQMLIAVDNNPWLSEKALLADGAPLGLQGEEL